MQYKIIVDKQPSSNPSSEKKEYIVDIEELRVKGDVYDSLNIELNRTYVTRRLSLSEYGVLSILEEPVIENLDEVNIELFEGDNYIYLMDMQGNKFYAEYLIKNDFTDLYVTTNQMNSAITQTAESIEFSVNQKLEGYSTTEEMNAAINIKAGEITSSVSKTYSTKEELNTAKSEIKQTTDSITSTVSTKVGKTEVISSINQSAEAVQINANKISLDGKQIDLTGDNISIKSSNFSVDKNGNMECNNAQMNNITINGGTIDLSESRAGGTVRFRITSPTSQSYMTSEASYYGQECAVGIYGNGGGFIECKKSGGTSTDINYNGITTPKLTCPDIDQSSLESIKKNITKFTKNATYIINNSDIYEYNLKSDKDEDKKMIGFVIGDNYKTPDEVIDKNGQAVSLYSAIGILWRGFQERQAKIDKLEERIEQLEKEVQHEKDTV